MIAIGDTSGFTFRPEVNPDASLSAIMKVANPRPAFSQAPDHAWESDHHVSRNMEKSGRSGMLTRKNSALTTPWQSHALLLNVTDRTTLGILTLP